ncbi:MAG: DUF370 domain-containing protein [Bacillota bacterium]|nr:DUF370 domain-containing protein [Bacillota bacterium]
MYIHVGASNSLPAADIIAVLDLDQVTVGPETNPMHTWLAAMEEAMRVDTLTEDVPRSLVITTTRIYLSPVSSATLRRRLTAARTSAAAGAGIREREDEGEGEGEEDDG